MAINSFQSSRDAGTLGASIGHNAAPSAALVESGITFIPLLNAAHENSSLIAALTITAAIVG